MGRVGGLGGSGTAMWSTMDLFRYTSSGVPDYTDGRDGQTTYFSSDGGGTTLSNQNEPDKGAPTLSFNNQYNSSGTQVNTGDTADWTQEKVFGSTGRRRNAGPDPDRARRHGGARLESLAETGRL